MTLNPKLYSKNRFIELSGKGMGKHLQLKVLIKSSFWSNQEICNQLPVKLASYEG
jgi:hypothetical protein